MSARISEIFSSSSFRSISSGFSCLRISSVTTSGFKPLAIDVTLSSYSFMARIFSSVIGIRLYAKIRTARSFAAVAGSPISFKSPPTWEKAFCIESPRSRRTSVPTDSYDSAAASWFRDSFPAAATSTIVSCSAEAIVTPNTDTGA